MYMGFSYLSITLPRTKAIEANIFKIKTNERLQIMIAKKIN
jgi:hypothetical protein